MMHTRLSGMHRLFPGKPLLLLALLAGSPTILLNAEASLETLQGSARKWIDIRRETTQLQADWTWQKELLASTRDTLAFQVDELQANEKLLAAQTESGQTKLEEMRQEVAILDSLLADSDSRNQERVERLLALRPLLPPRLSESLDLPFTSLCEADLTPGDRIQLLTTILNRCLQFNNAITYSEEVISTDEAAGSKVMSVLYWGLGQAYALDQATDTAYVGRPGNGRWEWTPANDAGPQIRQLIDIFQEQADPALVKAPIHVVSPPTE